jgi:uncharacterized protein (DUF2141 family)
MASCATVVPPDGGPKDTTAPVPLNYSPKNKVTNYKGERISIRFDEYVQLKDLQSQLVVSPAMPEKPEVYIKGKKLIIEPPDSLEENTTYTIFLGNGVVNYTESIPVKNFQYVLSTGAELDSLRITGWVQNAYDLKTEEGILVMLYKNFNDSTPYQMKPYYLAKTFGQGSFLLDNLSAGTYMIFALKDLNSNYIYDQPDEEIAFLDSLLVPAPVKPLDDTLNLIQPTFVKMTMFKEVWKLQSLLDHKVISPRHLRFTFRSPVKDLGLELLDTTMENWYYPVYNKTLDTLDLWLVKKLPDTLHLAMTDQQKHLDTLRMILKKPEKKKTGRQRRSQPAQEEVEQKKQEAKVEKLMVSSNVNQGVDFFKSPALRFDKPLAHFKSSGIQFYQVIDSNRKALDFVPKLRDSIKSDVLFLEAKLEESTFYEIVIVDSTFYDIFGNTNDSLKWMFKTSKKRSYGSLNLVVEHQETAPLIIQLLNAQNAVLEEHVLEDSVLVFPYLAAGKYSIKAIADQNRNGVWDTGDYILRRQPERVFVMKESINIRSNWDVDHRWIIE